MVVRSANIDYVKINGKNALHMSIENKLAKSVRFLLQKGARLHIIDLTEEDVCEKSQKNGLD